MLRSIKAGQTTIGYMGFHNGLNTPFVSLTLTPIYDDDLTVNNYTQGGIGVTVDTANTEIDWLCSIANDNSGVTIALSETLSDTRWVFRFTNDLTIFTTGVDSQKLFGAFLTSSTTIDNTTTQDSLGMSLINVTADRSYWTAQGDGVIISTSGGGGGDSTGLALSVAKNFPQIKRLSATLMNVEIFSDSGYTTSIISKDTTIASTIIGLANLKFQIFAVTTNRHSLGGSVEAPLVIWNGVSSV